MRLKMLYAFTLAMLVYLASTKCGNGCLKCNDKDECQFCDVFNGYYYSQMGCLQKTLHNCELIDPDGSCALCSHGFALDGATGRCTKFTAAQYIPNCNHYNSLGNCVRCNHSFSLVGGNCFKITESIPNCISYLQDGLCSVCNKGYEPSYDYHRCIKVTPVENCAKYSFVGCKKCKPGYILNENLSLKHFVKSPELNVILDMIFERNTSGVEKKVCQKAKIEGCIDPISLTRCRTCDTGYFLTQNSVCAKNPAESILGCLIYKTTDSCQKCSFERYLKDSKTCAPVTKILNCLLYDGAKSTTICLRCIEPFYLNKENNSCVASAYPNIQNCIKRAKTKDVCEKCTKGYVVTADGLTCVKAILNCQEHLINVHEGKTNVWCKQCQNGFFRSSSECKAGTIDFCMIYDIHTDMCQKCQDGYFATPDGRCKKHTEIEYCRSYSEVAHTCEKCDNQSILFSYKSMCVPAKAIYNCLEYSDNNTCSKCAPGLYPRPYDGSLCLLIPSSIGPCLNFNGKTLKCEKCIEGYMLSSGGTCEIPFNYITQACEKNSLIDVDFIDGKIIGCSKCQELAIPISSTNLGMCYKSAYLPFFKIGKFVRRCIRYQGQNCIECEAGYRLHDNNTCGFCDPENESALLVDFQSRKLNLCQSEGPKGCSQHIIFPNVGLRCTHVQMNFVAVIKSMKDEIPYPLNHSSPQPAILAYSAPIIEPIEIIMTGLIHVVHCLYYINIEDRIQCLRCKHGYVGRVDSKGFIVSCEVMNECDGLIEYGGLPSYLVSYSSCHICKKSSQIPILSIKENNTTEWKYSYQSGKSTLQCVDSTFFNDFVGEHCSMAADLFLEQEKTNIRICVACAPGYTPTYVGRKVISCNKIQNCVLGGGIVFNKCSECIDEANLKTNGNFAWLYKSSKGFDLSICVATSTSNCLFSQVNGNCVYCKPGYILSNLGYCHKLQIPHCSDDKSSPYFTLDNNDYNLYFVFLHFAKPGGCGKCADAYHSIQTDAAIDFCISNALSDLISVDSQASNRLIKNCMNYFNDSNAVLCAKCQPGYALTLDKKFCLVKFDGCKYINSNTHSNCSICESQFTNINGVCEINILENCKKYEKTIFKSAQEVKCRKCHNGFYLSSEGLCKAGTVSFCSKYSQESKDLCMVCKKGYGLLVNTLKQSFCIKLDLDYKCVEIDADAFKEGFVQCKKCSSDQYAYFVLSTNINEFKPKNVCLLTPTINGCQEYDISSTMVQSSFKCKDCQSDYYLTSDNLCLKRTALDPKCVKYNKTADECMECDTNFALNKDLKGCISMPLGIPDCMTYSDINVCTACRTPFYLINNSCKLVKKFTANCYLYSGPTTCKYCELGYFLENDQCAVAVAKNCLEYYNKYNCIRCPEGMALVEQDKVTSCLNLGIDNCIETEIVSPYRCIRCKEGFYPDDRGKCSRVSLFIKDCVIYESASVCNKCLPGKLLNSDGSECLGGPEILDVIDENCEDSYFKEHGVCAQCESGFYLMDGKCVPCDGQLSKTGCLTCDPINQSYCPICSPAHYMNSTHQCNLVEGKDMASIYKYYGEHLEYQEISSVDHPSIILGILILALQFVWM